MILWAAMVGAVAIPAALIAFPFTEAAPEDDRALEAEMAKRHPKVTTATLKRYAFPEEFYRRMRRCRGAPLPLATISQIERYWYADMWQAAGEPGLYFESRAPNAEAHATYRFTWLRTFHAPVFVRLEENARGEMRLEATQLHGEAGYPAQGVEKRLQRQLTPSEARSFKRELTWARLPLQPAVTCDHGYDGSNWIVEISKPGRYTYVERWSPDGGPVRNVGERFLSLTGWDFPDVY